MDTNVICNKCGRTAEYGEAIQSGWLIHQRIDKPEGYLVIRCPKDITGHAARLAGIPQQATSRRIIDNLDRGLWTYYGHPDDDYSAAVHRYFDHEIGDEFVLSYHKGRMPSFNSEIFDTVESLIMAMRKIEPDLRKWKLTEV